MHKGHSVVVVRCGLLIVLAGMMSAAKAYGVSDLIEKSAPVHALLTWNGQITLSIAIAVGIAGALLAILKLLKSPLATGTAIILGALVTILTLISSNAFDFNHKEYFARANLAEVWGLQMEKLLRDYEAAEEQSAKDQIFAEAMDLCQRIIALKHPKANLDNPTTATVGSSTSARAMFDLAPVPAAAAADGEMTRPPAWFSNPPSYTYAYYFSGSATSADLEKAKKEAVSNAQAHAEAFFMELLKGARPAPNEADAKGLANALRNSTRLMETAIEFDRGQQLFTGYALISLQKVLVESVVSYFGPRNGYPQSKELSEKLSSSTREWRQFYDKWNKAIVTKP